MSDHIPDPSFLRCFQNHRLSVNWLAFSPNSKYLASASDDKNVILWQLADSSSVCYKHSGHTDGVTSVSLANSFMVSGSKDCTARLWRINGNSEGLSHSSEASIYRCHSSPIHCVDISPDESQFCTSSDDKTVKIWSTSSTNKLISTLTGQHTNWVRHARFSKLCHHLLASCGDDGVICIWDLRDKGAAIKLTSKRRSTHFLGVQWHPNCEYVLSSSSSDFAIRLWDLRYEKAVQCYQVHDGFVSSTDFHPSGNFLISSSVDSTCKILDLYEGRTLFTLRAHRNQVNCAQFSPNGDHFVTAGQDRSILYWQSNLATANDYASDEEGSVRSPCNSETPPNNDILDSTDIRSVRDDLERIKIEQIDDLSAKVSELLLKNSCPEECSSESSLPNTATNSQILSDNSISILKSLLKQVEVISDSIILLEQRLAVVEKKTDKLH